MTINRIMTESGYERKDLDCYWTPAYCTQWLCDIGLKRRNPKSVTWEPCCGIGSISHVLKRNGHDVLSTDIHNHGYKDFDGVEDFLAVNEVDPVIDLIITNPPYKIEGVVGAPDCTALDFVNKSLALMQPVGGMVMMLLRHEYDCASTRKFLFDRPPFTAKLVLTARPRWIRENEIASQKENGPRHNYSWYLWDWRNTDLEANTLYLPLESDSVDFFA